MSTELFQEDAVDEKMGAHEIAVDALHTIHLSVRQQIARLDWEEKRRRNRYGGGGSTLHPIRAALVVLRQLLKIMDMRVPGFRKQQRNFERAHYETGPDFGTS